MITPEMTDIERQMAAIMDKVDDEGSVKSDFELRHEKENKYASLSRFLSSKAFVLLQNGREA